MVWAFRKKGPRPPPRLVRNFPDHRPPGAWWRRGRGLRGGSLRRLCKLPHRPVDKRSDQHDGRDDGRENTRKRLRIHNATIPSPMTD